MTSTSAELNVDQNATPDSEEEALQLYVGEKFEYYKRKWSVDATGKPKLISFNVGGFFGINWWASGRAMYLYASLFLILLLISDFIYLLSGFAAWEFTGFPMVASVIYGLFGNSSYHYSATKKVKKMMGENRTRKEFIAAGGFLWRRFFAFIGITFLYIIFSVFVLGI